MQLRLGPGNLLIFTEVHADGNGEDDPSLDSIPGLYDELLTATQEHGDVAIVIEDNAWSMSAHRDGRSVFEQLFVVGSQRHMIPVPKERVLKLWLKLID